MDKKLLVKTYDVGFGDCIFVRIPDGEKYFHILIDCGTKASATKDHRLKKAVEDVQTYLEKDEDGRGILNLLVATHAHADHIKGFDQEWFKKIKIERIWLSASMNKNHPQAKKMKAFGDIADMASRSILERSGAFISEQAKAMLIRSVCNSTALENLRKSFAKKSGISSAYPLYISRDLADEARGISADKLEKYDIFFEDGITIFRGFQDSATSLRILSPEWDIDKYYYGKGLMDSNSFIDMNLLSASDYCKTALDDPANLSLEEDDAKKSDIPNNISLHDFRKLQSRLLYSALAFSEKDGHLKNNTSVVLLLEWKGRKLLFTGDAEWDGQGVEENRHNSTWDVMLSQSAISKVLSQPLDFLKVSHHGSINGTPLVKEGFAKVTERFTDPKKTRIVVSTETGVYDDENCIPYPELMEKLGKQAENKCVYPGTPEANLVDKYQPQRTDQEAKIQNKEVNAVEVYLTPARKTK